jgi:predicted transposase/invertase (TIGR01784 family)
MSEKKLVRFDWAVKKLLRSKANFGILEGFLSELLKKDIKIDSIIESEGNQENDKDKFNRVDIVVKDENDEIILIEVQVNREVDFLSRMLYGSSKVITEYMKLKEPYSKVKKVYSVNILYFNLGHGEDYVYYGSTNFKGIHKNDELQLNKRQQSVYGKSFVSEVYPEYYIIKVDEFDDVAKDTLDEWIYFLKNEEVKDDFTAKGLLEAKEKLDSMKLSPEERVNYNRFLENLHYEASMLLTSRLEGEEIGIEKGELKKGLKIAKNLKKIGMNIEAISEHTELSIETLKKHI